MRFRSLITVLCLLVEAHVQAKETYKAAVVTLPALSAIPGVKAAIDDPSSYNPSDEQITKMIENNVKIYEKYIREAGKEKVDILAFSESNLNYFGMPNKKTQKRFLVKAIPSAKDRVAPCDGKKYDKILARVCIAVRSAKVYAMINLIEEVDCAKFKNTCEQDHGLEAFNTNVVFDRNGVIIARYRKINLFREVLIDIPKNIEIDPFTTDFGETFFSIICFDLILKTPLIDVINRGVKNIILTTMWYARTPFLVAPQAQMGVAIANNINLMAACGQWIDHGSAGTGLYAGAMGAVKMYLSEIEGGRMLVGELPKAKNLANILQRQSPIRIMDFSGMSRNELTFRNELTKLEIKQHAFQATTQFAPLQEKYSVCPLNDKRFKQCCTFDVKFKTYNLKKGQLGYTYFFASYWGKRKFGGSPRLFGEFYCAIVACTGNLPRQDCGQRYPASKDTLYKTVDFESVNVTMTIQGKADASLMKNVVVMPSTLSVKFLPLQPKLNYQFTSELKRQTRTSLITMTKPRNDVYTFGFYGRNFNDDGPVTREIYLG